jgi:hypothetical protein
MGVTMYRNEGCGDGEFDVDGAVAGWTAGVYGRMG